MAGRNELDGRLGECGGKPLDPADRWQAAAYTFGIRIHCDICYGYLQSSLLRLALSGGSRAAPTAAS